MSPPKPLKNILDDIQNLNRLNTDQDVKTMIQKTLKYVKSKEISYLKNNFPELNNKLQELQLSTSLYLMGYKSYYNSDKEYLDKKKEVFQEISTVIDSFFNLNGYYPVSKYHSEFFRQNSKINYIIPNLESMEIPIEKLQMIKEDFERSEEYTIHSFLVEFMNSKIKKVNYNLSELTNDDLEKIKTVKQFITKNNLSYYSFGTLIKNEQLKTDVLELNLSRELYKSTDYQLLNKPKYHLKRQIVVRKIRNYVDEEIEKGNDVIKLPAYYVLLQSVRARTDLSKFECE